MPKKKQELTRAIVTFTRQLAKKSRDSTTVYFYSNMLRRWASFENNR